MKPPRKTRKQPKPKLRSIEAELKDCVREFHKHRTKYAWCLHHDQLVESMLYVSPSHRIDVINRGKPESQQAIRFRNFRPVKSMKQLEMNQWNHKALRAQLNQEWPGNTWNGKNIF